MSTEVLSVRVRKELKRKAEELGLDLRSIVERALKEEIRKQKVKRFQKILEEALESMDLSEEEWIEAVRESRSER
ncbi:MAG: type II toxin-antitoxin system CcdA family antitoxin [Candidatus Korarchaeota archaeon]|nr:type II toxin-antitoxin system CcdA family antitoxin [Candidatus Korarchaeota archaeon]